MEKLKSFKNSRDYKTFFFLSISNYTMEVQRIMSPYLIEYAKLLKCMVTHHVFFILSKGIFVTFGILP